MKIRELQTEQFYVHDQGQTPVDTGNYRIQKFDSNGNFLTQWGSYGTNNGQFPYVNSVAVDLSGNVFVNDENRIEKFSP